MQRHSTGGVRKQRGRWIGVWRENGVKKSKVLGLTKEMTKGEARDAVALIVSGVREEKSGPGAFREIRDPGLHPVLFAKMEALDEGQNSQPYRGASAQGIQELRTVRVQTRRAAGLPR